MKSFILSIDQSTSATKAMLFDHEARLVNRVSIVHRQMYSKPGFVEHDPQEIYENTIMGLFYLTFRLSGSRLLRDW